MNVVHQREEQEENEKRLWIAPWILGFLRGILRCPVEQPFDTIKTRWQANPVMYNSFRNASRHIYKTEGFRGFYRGAAPNSIKYTIREFYRYPLLFWIPDFYAQHLHKSSTHAEFPERQATAKFLCGITLSTVESFITCPLERMKTILMTRSLDEMVCSAQLHSPNRIFLESHSKLFSSNSGCSREGFFQYLMRGFAPLWLRQSLSWVTFLVGDVQCKNLMRWLTHQEKLSYLSLMCVAVIVGTINTLVTMPFDTIKTQAQKFSRAPHATKLKSLSLIAVNFIKSYGFTKLYVGFYPRLTQYLLNAMITVPMLDVMENWKNSVGHRRHENSSKA